jgi:hypothetical protein
MLATMLATMLVSYHNHVYSAALLVVPGMVVAANGGGPGPLPRIIRAAAFVPAASFALTFLFLNVLLASTEITALIVVALGTVVVAELKSQAAGSLLQRLLVASRQAAPGTPAGVD